MVPQIQRQQHCRNEQQRGSPAQSWWRIRGVHCCTRLTGWRKDGALGVRGEVGRVEAEGSGERQPRFVGCGAARLQALDGAHTEPTDGGEVFLRPGALFTELFETDGSICIVLSMSDS